jgi:hypothetical protein
MVRYNRRIMVQTSLGKNEILSEKQLNQKGLEAWLKK